MSTNSRSMKAAIAALILLASFLCLTCDNGTEPKGEKKIELSLHEWQAAAVDSQTVEVTNGAGADQFTWHVFCDSSWLSVADSLGLTPGKFIMWADSNKSGVSRSCSVVVEVYGSSEHRNYIEVTQNPLTGLILIGQYPTNYYTEYLCVDGDYLYFTYDLGEFNVLDVSNPAKPAEVGWYPWIGRPTDAVKQGNYVYVASDRFENSTFRGAVAVYDVSSPFKPSMVAYQKLDWGNYRIAISGNYLYSTEYETLEVIDVSDPKNPAIVFTQHAWLASTAVDAYDDYLLFSDSENDFFIMDNSDPRHPVPIDTLPLTHPPYDIDAQNGFAYVACFDGVLEVVDISDATKLQLVAEYNAGGELWKVLAEGDYLYVSGGTEGILILDISSPANPILAATYKTPSRVFDIDVSGGYIYVADVDYGLLVFRFVP